MFINLLLILKYCKTQVENQEYKAHQCDLKCKKGAEENLVAKKEPDNKKDILKTS